MIEIKNINLSGRLDSLSCNIPQGKLVGIMGANGAGKSSLLKVIAGILKPTSGEIWLENRKIDELSPTERSQKIAYLAQNISVAWQLSVYDLIALGLSSPLHTEQEVAEVERVAKQFSVSHLLDKDYQTLSGGEQARVQLARSAIKNAPFFLADEPIAALDPYYQIEIIECLKNLTPQKTCVMAIHHLSLAYRFCDEIILLKSGKLLDHGTTQAVLTTENLANGFGIKAEVNQAEKLLWGIEKI